MAFVAPYRPANPLAINPGELRHLVEIQQPNIATPDERGMSVAPASWTTVLSAHAAIYTAGGRETAMASQIVSDVSHVVKIRWANLPIKANYRVVFGGRNFAIQYVENVLERNRVLLIYCLESDGGGV